MFQGKIHLYKNIDGKEEEVRKEFDNETEFNAFINNNPELKRLQESKWTSPEWPHLASLQDRISDARKTGDQSFIDEMKAEIEVMEKKMGEFYERSKNYFKK